MKIDLDFFKQNADHHITSSKQAFIDHFNLHHLTDTEIAWEVIQQIKNLGIAVPIVNECPICGEKTIYTVSLEGVTTKSEMLNEFEITVDGLTVLFTRPTQMPRFDSLNFVKTVALVQHWTDTDLSTIEFQTLCKIIDEFANKMFTYECVDTVQCKNKHKVKHDFALGLQDLLILLDQMC